MNPRRTLAAFGRLAAATVVLAAPLAAQEGRIASRVSALRNGVVELRFPARAGVCGDGRSYIRVGEHTRFGRWSSDEIDRPCVGGPARVALTVSNGEVRRARAYVGPSVPGSADEIVETTSAEAASYLLDLARRENKRGDDDVVFGAVLGENVVAWPALIEIARLRGQTGRKGHQAATFWLGRYASAKTAGSDDPFIQFEDDDKDADLKEHAVFVLSQMRGDEGIEAMLRVARTHREPRVRSQAIFWLGESGDPRAIDLFEEILRGR